MKAKEFALRWNQEHPDLHFYLEGADDITEVRIRFQPHRHQVGSVQYRQFKTVVASRSNKVMMVSTNMTLFNSGAVDILVNPCYDGQTMNDIDYVVADTLEYLGEKVFPKYEKGGE